MGIEITLIVLLAAAFHAGWNTLIKISGDRVAVMAFVTLAGSLISLLFLPFVEAPAPESWPLLALTILLHTGYHFFLPIAYDHGDLGQVYPISRGSAPILVTLGAFFFAGEYLAPIAVMGVICLAVGVMSLTFEKTTGVCQETQGNILCVNNRCFYCLIHTRRWHRCKTGRFHSGLCCLVDHW